jgi:hypothetical protein
MMRFSQPSKAAAARSCVSERHAVQKHLLREVVAQARAAAKVIHELAHARVPARNELGERARIAGTGERDDERIGRLLKIGGR